jgi:hypothetical protein
MHKTRSHGKSHAEPVPGDPRTAPHAGGADDLVKLDPDHPGFNDAAYCARRNRIARLALDYHAGVGSPAW